MERVALDLCTHHLNGCLDHADAVTVHGCIEPGCALTGQRVPYLGMARFVRPIASFNSQEAEAVLALIKAAVAVYQRSDYNSNETVALRDAIAGVAGFDLASLTVGGTGSTCPDAPGGPSMTRPSFVEPIAPADGSLPARTPADLSGAADADGAAPASLGQADGADEPLTCGDDEAPLVAPVAIYAGSVPLREAPRGAQPRDYTDALRLPADLHRSERG